MMTAEMILLAFCAGLCCGVSGMAIWLAHENKEPKWDEEEDRWWEHE